MDWSEGTGVLVLRCKSGYFAKIINGRWLVHKCDLRRCKSSDGAHTHHVWDLYTGRVRDEVSDDPMAWGTPMQGANSHAVR